jgi:hypothetical protein
MAVIYPRAVDEICLVEKSRESSKMRDKGKKLISRRVSSWKFGSPKPFKVQVGVVEER